MPSMASLILRAAARAAGSAAWAASRCAAAAAAAAARSGSGGAAAARSGPGGAAAARSGSGGAAAASDPLMRASSVAPPAAPAASDLLMRASSVVAPAAPVSSTSVHLPIAARPPRSNPAYDPPPPPFDGPTFFNPDRVKFEADEKDLQSDEALWALYERWCKFFDQKRDRDEMVRRFSCFKMTVLRVEENKKSDLPYRLGINMFADGKLWELHRPEVPSTGFVRKRPYSTSPIYARALDFLLEDPKGAGPGGRRN